jgi:hypothetical protein
MFVCLYDIPPVNCPVDSQDPPTTENPPCRLTFIRPFTDQSVPITGCQGPDNTTKKRILGYTGMDLLMNVQRGHGYGDVCGWRMCKWR